MASVFSRRWCVNGELRSNFSALGTLRIFRYFAVRTFSVEAFYTSAISYFISEWCTEIRISGTIKRGNLACLQHPTNIVLASIRLAETLHPKKQLHIQPDNTESKTPPINFSCALS